MPSGPGCIGENFGETFDAPLCRRIGAATDPQMPSKLRRLAQAWYRKEKRQSHERYGDVATVL